MAQSQIAVENNFSRGLISEATGLNFPENACTDTINCVFDQKGVVTRRLGIDYEASATTNNVTRSTSFMNEYTWESVAGDGTLSFLVCQVGGTLYFYAVPSSGALSGSRKSFTVALSTFQVSGAPSPAGVACQFASGFGDLFVVNPYCEPFYITYDPVGDSVTATQITVRIRDLAGIEENTPFNIRPSTINTKHKYNLWNQGWYVGVAQVLNALGATPSGTYTPYELWNVYKSDREVNGYPSNSDVWWYHKDSVDAFSMKTMKYSGSTPPSTPAPKGHYIMKAFQQYKGYSSVTNMSQASTGNNVDVFLDESVPWVNGASVVIEGSSVGKFNGTFTVTSVGTGSACDSFTINVSPTGSATDSNTNRTLYAYLANSEAAHVTAGTNRPRAVAFFAGRVWYGGTVADGFNDKLYFTKIVEQASDYERCYQVNDPTGEELSDLLPSDGGVISIPDMGNLIKMISLGQELFLFATNGVWSISGSQGIGFAANDYTVRKISNVPSVSPLSFVNADGVPIFWNNNGIYTMTSQQSGYSIDNISDKSIKTWFAALPTSSKTNAKGVYNPSTKIIQWVYRTTASTTTDNIFEYDGVLNFNTLTGAFYPWLIYKNTGFPFVTGITAVGYTGSVPSTTKFITSKLVSGSTYAMTFAEERQSTYADWGTPNVGQAYESNFTTGYRVKGGGLNQQWGDYISVYSNAVSNSSLLMRAKWDYSNNASTKEWSTEQECYFSRTNKDVLRRRVKVRGRGTAVQLFFRSSSGKPFSCIGWSIKETVNPGP